jgi:hypothetical protein
LLPEGDAAPALLATAAVVLLVGHLALRVRYGSLSDGLDGTALILIGLALAPWISRIVSSFKLGGLELIFVRRQLAEAKEQIEALRSCCSAWSRDTRSTT